MITQQITITIKIKPVHNSASDRHEHNFNNEAERQTQKIWEYAKKALGGMRFGDVIVVADSVEIKQGLTVNPNRNKF